MGDLDPRQGHGSGRCRRPQPLRQVGCVAERQQHVEHQPQRQQCPIRALQPPVDEREQGSAAVLVHIAESWTRCAAGARTEGHGAGPGRWRRLAAGAPRRAGTISAWDGCRAASPLSSATPPSSAGIASHISSSSLSAKGENGPHPAMLKRAMYATPTKFGAPYPPSRRPAKVLSARGTSAASSGGHTEETRRRLALHERRRVSRPAVGLKPTVQVKGHGQEVQNDQEGGESMPQRPQGNRAPRPFLCRRHAQHNVPRPQSARRDRRTRGRPPHAPRTGAGGTSGTSRLFLSIAAIQDACRDRSCCARCLVTAASHGPHSG